jgi:hypothetical protein
MPGRFVNATKAAGGAALAQVVMATRWPRSPRPHCARRLRPQLHMLGHLAVLALAPALLGLIVED